MIQMKDVFGVKYEANMKNIKFKRKLTSLCAVNQIRCGGMKLREIFIQIGSLLRQDFKKAYSIV